MSLASRLPGVPRGRQSATAAGDVQVDSVLSRLTALKERIEGTEALIEIDLDHRRNELVAFDLVSHSDAAMTLSLFSALLNVVKHLTHCHPVGHVTGLVGWLKQAKIFFFCCL